MREIRKSGSEGGARQTNVPFLPLSLAFASHTLSLHFRMSDDVDGTGKMGRGDGFIVADPVGEDDDLLGALATPANGFLIYAHAEERARFDGTDIGGGVGIAHRAALPLEAVNSLLRTGIPVPSKLT